MYFSFYKNVLFVLAIILCEFSPQTKLSLSYSRGVVLPLSRQLRAVIEPFTRDNHLSRLFPRHSTKSEADFKTSYQDFSSYIICIIFFVFTTYNNFLR